MITWDWQWVRRVDNNAARGNRDVVPDDHRTAAHYMYVLLDQDVASDAKKRRLLAGPLNHLEPGTVANVGRAANVDPLAASDHNWLSHRRLRSETAEAKRIVGAALEAAPHLEQNDSKGPRSFFAE
jgi:hypothetical protein